MSAENSGERPQSWEDVCVQCGLCCLVKLHTDTGDVFLTKILCDHLDKETKKCKCYSADFDCRESTDGGCAAHNGSRLDLNTLHNDYIVPGCCPYVKKYVGKNKLKMPIIDLKSCAHESEVQQKDVHKYIIGDSWKLFKYNPAVNKLLATKGRGKSK